MQVTRKALIKDGWVVCSKCGHKLGRVVGKKPTGIEIKCHSCKEINLVDKCKPKQYKIPHYIHCKEYKESTNTCMAIFRALGLETRCLCRPFGCRTCKDFKPKEEFKENYKELANGRF